MKPTPKETLSILVDSRMFKFDPYDNFDDKRGGSVSVTFVLWTDKGEVRNPGSSSFENPFFPFDNLRFEARFKEGLAEDSGNIFGWSLEYRDLYSVDAEKTAVMSKMFKRIEKARASLPVQPNTFGQFVALYAFAMGARLVITGGKDNGTGKFGYDSMDWFCHPIADTCPIIDRLIDKTFHSEPKVSAAQ